MVSVAWLPENVGKAGKKMPGARMGGLVEKSVKLVTKLYLPDRCWLAKLSLDCINSSYGRGYGGDISVIKGGLFEPH